MAAQRVISTSKVTCYQQEGESHEATIKTYDDGHIEVECDGDCSVCPYKEYRH